MDLWMWWTLTKYRVSGFAYNRLSTICMDELGTQFFGNLSAVWGARIFLGNECGQKKEEKVKTVEL